MNTLFSEYSGNNFLLDVEYTAGKTRSIDKGIRKIGLYDFFDDLDCGNTFFVNGYGFEYEAGITGISGGIGFRQLYDELIFGLNFYYDYQDDLADLNQFGWGFEVFSDCLNLYGNFYIPVGNKDFAQKTFFYDDYVGDYEVTCHQKSIRSKGFDLMFTKVLFTECPLDIILAGGVYGFDLHKCKGIIGFQGYLEFNIKERFYVRPIIYHDELYDTNFGVKIGLSFPLWEQCESLQCLHNPVIRRGFIPSVRDCSYRTNYTTP